MKPYSFANRSVAPLFFLLFIFCGYSNVHAAAMSLSSLMGSSDAERDLIERYMAAQPTVIIKVLEFVSRGEDQRNFLFRQYKTMDIRHHETKQTPLMVAAQYGHAHRVKELLEAGADPNLVDTYKRTALMYAAQKGSLECVARLLRGVENREKKKLCAIATMIDFHGDTAAMCARRAGHEDVAKAIEQVIAEQEKEVAAKQHPEKKGKLYFSAPLNELDETGRQKMKLLDSETLGLSENQLQLLCALCTNDEPLLDSVINTPGFDGNFRFPATIWETRYTPLMAAVASGHIGLVRKLIPHSDINAADEDGMTAVLILLSKLGSNFTDEQLAEVLRLLINTPGCDLTKTDKKNVGALCMAIFSRNVQFVELIAQKLATKDKNVLNKKIFVKCDGLTEQLVLPLDVAALFGSAETLKFLSDNGAVFDDTNILYYATMNIYGHVPTIKEMFDYILPKMSVDTLNLQGETALAVAAGVERAEVVQLLLEHNPDPYKKSKAGKSAAQTAREHLKQPAASEKQRQCAQLILDYCAVFDGNQKKIKKIKQQEAEEKRRAEHVERERTLREKKAQEEAEAKLKQEQERAARQARKEEARNDRLKQEEKKRNAQEHFAESREPQPSSATDIARIREFAQHREQEELRLQQERITREQEEIKQAQIRAELEQKARKENHGSMLEELKQWHAKYRKKERERAQRGAAQQRRTQRELALSELSDEESDDVQEQVEYELKQAAQPVPLTFVGALQAAIKQYQTSIARHGAVASTARAVANSDRSVTILKRHDARAQERLPEKKATNQQDYNKVRTQMEFRARLEKIVKEYLLVKNQSIFAVDPVTGLAPAKILKECGLLEFAKNLESSRFSRLIIDRLTPKVLDLLKEDGEFIAAMRKRYSSSRERIGSDGMISRANVIAALGNPTIQKIVLRAIQSEAARRGDVSYLHALAYHDHGIPVPVRANGQPVAQLTIDVSQAIALQDDNGYSMLQTAVGHNQIDFARTVLALNGDPDALSASGESAWDQLRAQHSRSHNDRALFSHTILALTMNQPTGPGLAGALRRAGLTQYEEEHFGSAAASVSGPELLSDTASVHSSDSNDSLSPHSPRSSSSHSSSGSSEAPRSAKAKPSLSARALAFVPTLLSGVAPKTP